MHKTWLTDTLALGALSGMRTAAGATTLALRLGGGPARVMPAVALTEMILDKAPFVGSRLAPAPLAARAVMGALLGGLLARSARDNAATGALVGAAAAVAGAYVAYHARKRLPLSNITGGLLEDAFVVGVGALLLSRPESSGDTAAG